MVLILCPMILVKALFQVTIKSSKFLYAIAIIIAMLSDWLRNQKSCVSFSTINVKQNENQLHLVCVIFCRFEQVTGC